jgi:predicted dehydrogenase
MFVNVRVVRGKNLGKYIMEKIKCAVVGLGRIASLLEEDTLREKPCTHTGAITANEDCILAAGCDIDEERRKQYAEKWQVPVFQDAAQMLIEHKPQILSIATHPDSHYHYCRLASQHGVKVVVCEKPLADSIGKAKKIAHLAKEGRITVVTNHERRYCADYARTKAILEEGKLGPLQAVRACLYMGRTTRLIDQLWHDGTHLIDAIMFLTGGVMRHKRRWGAKLSKKSGTAWLESELKFQPSSPPISSSASSAPLRLCVNSSSSPVLTELGAGRDHLVFEIEFSCEKGRLRIGNGVFEVWESIPSPYAEKFRSLKLTDEKFTGETGYFANMLRTRFFALKSRSESRSPARLTGLG